MEDIRKLAAAGHVVHASEIALAVELDVSAAWVGGAEFTGTMFGSMQPAFPDLAASERGFITALVIARGMACNQL
jgi:hypothetical protein